MTPLHEEAVLGGTVHAGFVSSQRELRVDKRVGLFLFETRGHSCLPVGSNQDVCSIVAFVVSPRKNAASTKNSLPFSFGCLPSVRVTHGA